MTRGRILVADDSPTVVEMLKSLLAANGHEVIVAADGIAAAEAAFAYVPDLVVADVTMPRMNGYQLCRLFKNDPATAAIPVVLLTSRDQPRDRFWGTKSGADHYLIKDSGLAELVGSLQRLIEEQPAGAPHAQPAARSDDGEIDVLYRVNELLDRKLFEATILNEVAKVGHSIEDFEGCAGSILTILGQFVDFAVAGICFGGQDGHLEVVIRANRPVSEEALADFQQRTLDCLSSLRGQTLVLEDVSIHLDRADSDDKPLGGLGNFRTHPLLGPDNTIGLLATAGGAELAAAEQRQFLSNIADQVYLVLDNARLYRKVRMLAVSDEQTGLYNVRHFRDRLSAELARAVRYNTPLSVIMLDVDHFKQVNDRYGHLFGDLVLKQIAGILQQQIRDTDLAARYGGEEFVVVLPAATEAAALEAAERLRASVAAAPLGNAEIREPITISLGVATYPGRNIHDMDDLVKAADSALYRAKDAGRNAVRAHTQAEEPTPR